MTGPWSGFLEAATKLRLARCRAVFCDFVGWWGHELALLVPNRLRMLLASRAELAVADVTADGVSLSRGRPNANDGAINLSAADLEAVGRAELRRRLVVATGIDDDEVVIRVPENLALIKSVDLPLAVEPTLRQTLTLALDSQTPFRPDQVYFDFAVRHRDRGAGRLTVDYVVVPRSVVDGAAAILAALGLRPARIVVDGAHKRTVNLRDSDEGGARSPVAAQVTRALAAAATVLAVAVVLVPTYQRSVRLAELREEIATVKREADAVTALRAEIDRIAAENGFLAARKRETPLTLQVIDRLSRLFPDDTWLIELHSGAGQVRVVGFSAAASRLISLIEGSGTFANARFRSPVTPDAGGTAERFDLGFDLLTEKR
jgi:general secretion pathway protein L